MLCVSIAVASTPKPTFTAKEGFIPVKYGKIWFRIVGIDKPGVPLLVLHGGPGMTHYYLESLEALADQRPVIFYDQLGCGNSKATTKNLALFCTVQSFVDEVDTVRKALGLKKVHILGHSWGSMLAVEYMTRKNPKGVLSLILAGPYMSTRRWISDAKSLLKTLPTDIQKTVEECEAQKDFDNPKYQQAMMVFYKLFFCRLDPWPPCLEKAFQTMGYDVYNYMWGPSEFTCTGVLKNHDITQKLKQLKVPVLYICGEFDEARPETTKYYQSITPGAKMYVIKGASHCHHLEKPKIFNKIVREFLSEHDK
ncbi:MAG: proline iminopeptidase-family hydrolase [Synergistetes bacterium]|nr:proline iminopeptidase-family hydrolase [Synergistota bacterium]